jgi:aldose 1-epimerase
MRQLGRQRRLAGRTRLGLTTAAVAAVAVAGSLTATQAVAAASSQGTQSHHGCSLGETRAAFGSTVEPYTGQTEEVYRYTLTNAHCMKVQILTYGGIVQDIWVPDKHGNLSDVVLGFKTLSDYVTEDSPPVTSNGGPYFGETIGRYGNRIAKGKFTLDQPNVGPVTYTLPVNNGVNSLHGGLVGFGNHIWADQPVKSSGTVGVQLTLNSPNGDESHAAGTPGCPNGCTGYPAAIKVVLTYTLNNSNQLVLHYTTTNESSNLNTVINLTNHSYFNLQGEASPAGSAYGQYLQVNASKYTPTDTTQIPLGYLASVVGTPFDFLKPHTIGSRIDDYSANFNSPGYNQLLIAQGYDHNWVLNGQTKGSTGPLGLNLAARAFDPVSGRQLAVWTDQPGVQIYTSNFLNGTLVGISGHAYRQGAAYTFETQHFPDSPNQHNFPSTELKAGQTVNSSTVFAFSS